ncbi:hypothetical protein MNBD_BACTEROID01-1128 [hydrothermal vent metagenome]|uniref:Uncharacterized protein n=1 Tax=hydrothermal vent metagenome TaxID=652676 RepID=A0A3B0U8C6_9ZZZZ
MNTNRENTGIFFLWLAALTIMLHAVIPHNHHFDPYSFFQNNDAQACSSEENNTEPPSVHCHAFNGTIVNRINAVTVENPGSHNTNLYSLRFSEPLLSIAGIGNTIYLLINFTPPKQYLRFYSPLRAPPVRA